MKSAAKVSSVQQVCASNERAIGQALMIYADKHDKQFPPDLGSLVAETEMPAQVFLCPNAHKQLPGNWDQMNNDEKAAWVNSNASYAYLGKGMTMDAVTPETILLHDRQNRHQGAGMNLLYGDGHVAFVPVEQAKEALKAQKK